MLVGIGNEVIEVVVPKMKVMDDYDLDDFNFAMGLVNVKSIVFLKVVQADDPVFDLDYLMNSDYGIARAYEDH